jgi:hypothetical protein
MFGWLSGREHTRTRGTSLLQPQRVTVATTAGARFAAHSQPSNHTPSTHATHLRHHHYLHHSHVISNTHNNNKNEAPATALYPSSFHCVEEWDSFTDGDGAVGVSSGNSLSYATHHYHGHLLMCASEDGTLSFLNTLRAPPASMWPSSSSPSSLSSSRWSERETRPSPSVLQAHSNAIFDACWIDKETKVATAAGDQTVGVFDIVNMQRLHTLRGHAASVKCVRAR